MMVEIEIECCVDCHLHNWCSRHNEDKYHEFYERIETKAKSIFPRVNITKNLPPAHYIKRLNLSSLGVGLHRYLDSQTN